MLGRDFFLHRRLLIRWPKKGGNQWCRQLLGTGACTPPPRLPTSYFF